MVIRIKTIIPSLSLMFASIILSLLIVELLLRIFFPQQLYSFEQHLFMASEEYGYCLTPNTAKMHSQPEYSYIIKSNSFGFRGKEPNFNAAYRVLVLGDSFGMGQGVKEGTNLCELSQLHFVKKNLDIDVFNTSISAYSAINQLKVLKNFIFDYKPHLVILLFYWNDIGPKDSLSVYDGYLVLHVGNKLTAPIREWLNNNSHAYSLVKRFYYTFLKKGSPARGNSGSIPESEINVTVENISRMKKICDDNGTTFSIILLPLEGAFEGSDEFKRSKDVFIRKLTEKSIAYRDWGLLLPNENRETLVYKFDHHWTEYGHEYFSKYLNQIILEAYKVSDRKTGMTVAE